MLSYRHAFHAGSPHDVLKHAVWASCLVHAVQKPKPLYVLDTHAGAGTYDLGAPMAEKLAEWRAGILPVMRASEDALPALLAPLVEAVRKLNPDRRLTRYPGSSRLAADLLRPIDRLETVELHGTDHALLAAELGGRPGVAVPRADGLEVLVARMPPAERRGLVLIDPSYEVKVEPEAVARALARAGRRFATGTFLVWYPVIDRARASAFVESLAEASPGKALQIELRLLQDKPGHGMTASGLIVVNPPHGLEAALAAALPWLDRVLGAAESSTAGWLVPETPATLRGASRPSILREEPRP